MGGFSTISGDQYGSVMNSDNASFDGTSRGGVLSSNGQLWVGSGSSPRVKVGAITSPNSTITVGYSSPNITLDVSHSGLFNWSDTSGTVSATAFHGYFITASCTSTLPASPSEGDTISYVVDTSSTLTITANTGQYIRIGSAISASAGTAANNAWGDSVTLVFRSSDSNWIATSVIGTWTVT